MIHYCCIPDISRHRQAWTTLRQRTPLDRYLIIEREDAWEMFNWFQYYTPKRFSDELKEAGFTIDSLTESLAGDPLTEDGATLAAIASK
jgi:hypothetical protein